MKSNRTNRCGDTSTGRDTDTDAGTECHIENASNVLASACLCGKCKLTCLGWANLLNYISLRPSSSTWTSTTTSILISTSIASFASILMPGKSGAVIVDLLVVAQAHSRFLHTNFSTQHSSVLHVAQAEKWFSFSFPLSFEI